MLSLLSRVSLKITAPLVLCLPVVFAITVLALIGFFEARSTAEAIAQEELAEVHARINQRLSSLLSLPARINQLNARLIRDGQLSQQHLGSWRRWFYQELTSFSMLSGVLWGSADGRVVWVFRYPYQQKYRFGIKKDPDGDDLVEYDLQADGTLGAAVKSSYEPLQRPWYQAAVKAGQPTWAYYQWSDGDPIPAYGLGYTQPHFDTQDRLLGVLDVEISLHDVSQFLASLKVGKTGLAYVVDAQGRLVAHSLPQSPAEEGPDQALTHGPAQGPGPATTSTDARIAETAQRLQQLTVSDTSSVDDQFEQVKRISGGQSTTVTIQGRRHLMFVSPLDPRTALNWQIVTVVPEEDFLWAAYASRNRILLWGLGVVALTLIAGVFLASAALQPLLALLEHVRTIGGGKLDQNLVLRYSPEFALLSDEINTMTAGLRDRLRMRRALATAMEVQQNLLPSETPEVAGLDIYGHSTYCDETGGDYYDYLDIAGLDGDALAIAVGDVMGHGVAAAMLMATARGILRSRCQEPGSLGDLLDHLNGMLVADTRGERFMTMLLMVLDPRARTLRWASAGHDRPLIYHRAVDDWIEQESFGGLPLGIVEDAAPYQEHCYRGVQQGQIFVVATDGVWETNNNRGELFGKDRLRDLVRRHAKKSSQQISQHLHKALAAFRGSSSPEDDVTFVIIKVV